MSSGIEITNLKKMIKNKEIVKGLNFTVNPGEVFGFIGPNGAGKTTTIRMMVGLIRISEGDVKINGNSIKTNKKEALNSVGAIVENPEMYPYMTGYQNLKYFGQLSGVKSETKIKNILNLVGLNESSKNKVSTYSLGMRQRLGIAQALIHDPKVLILDEPTNGLDPNGIFEMRKYIRKIAFEQNIAVIVSSHLINEIELMCDQIGIIKQGKMIDLAEANYINEEQEFVFKVEPYNKAIELLKQNEANFHFEANEEKIILYCPEEEIPKVVDFFVTNEIKVFRIEEKIERLEEKFMELTQTTKGD
ncbi:ABC transporter ATP-binding protein [Marinococcus sp. PL1-022]|uniref:ABC transporter ATP-binding protein n=1 Tax=Marinococcus sp. PL1-022 TaxID=3095363 RepID=UPI0029C15E8B|nr:ABC transporter ATP-binding protein [Marinococcus sp. PL1-022]MDX6154478.1 ABC transporter ATP-binding protein [Marinococcus sp. PL1-022]